APLAPAESLAAEWTDNGLSISWQATPDPSRYPRQMGSLHCGHHTRHGASSFSFATRSNRNRSPRIGVFQYVTDRGDVRQPVYACSVNRLKSGFHQMLHVFTYSSIGKAAGYIKCKSVYQEYPC